MTQVEKEGIIQQIREEFKNNNNGVTKKILSGVLIGLIPIMIVAGISSYMGVMKAEKVTREKVINLEINVRKIQNEQIQQWGYIIDNARTRGEEFDIKDFIKEEE